MAGFIHPFFVRRLTKLSIVYAWLAVLSCKAVFAQKQGQALIDSLQAALPELKEDTTKAKLFAVLGNLYSSIDPDKGIRNASQALNLSVKLQWQNGIGTAYNILGICYVYKADYARSLDYWRKGLKIFREQDNKQGVLKIVGNIGAIYQLQGDYSSALENYFIALKYAEELGDKQSIGINMGNIGGTYEYLKDYPKALAYDQKAVAIFKELDNRSYIALYLGNIGNLYRDLKKYDKALESQFAALRENELLGNNEGKARDMHNIGWVYAASGGYKKAFEFYFKSLTFSEKAGFKNIEGKALSSIAELILEILKKPAAGNLALYFPADMVRAYQMLLNRKGLLRTAIAHLNKSIGVDLETQNLNELQADYNLLSEAQKMAGNYIDAMKAKEQFILIKDSVFSMTSKVKITNLEAKREIELKDKQILINRLELANKRNERIFFIAGIALLLIVIAIIIRNIKLAAAKETIENKLSAFQARMNPHFIFNSLNSIQYLVLNNETEQSVDYLSEFSTLMRQILDNSAKNKVMLQTEIDMLRSYIQLEHLRFSFFKWDIRMPQNIRADAVEIPGMIVQPFVENAILHGLTPKGAGGILDISFELAGNQVICTVDDNGIGRERSFELKSHKNNNHQSHGVHIATNRLTLLNDKRRGVVNKVTYIDKKENSIATGTKVIIQIPVL